MGKFTFEISYSSGGKDIVYADEFEVQGKDTASRYRFYKEAADEDGQYQIQKLVLEAPVINVNSVRVVS